MKELDVVRLKEDFKSIPAGTNGPIVLEYDGHCYEVEFVDDDSNTIGVLTTPSEILELAKTE